MHQNWFYSYSAISNSKRCMCSNIGHKHKWQIVRFKCTINIDIQYSLLSVNVKYHRALLQCLLCCINASPSNQTTDRLFRNKLNRFLRKIEINIVTCIRSRLKGLAIKHLQWFKYFATSNITFIRNTTSFQTRWSSHKTILLQFCYSSNWGISSFIVNVMKYANKEW